MNSNNPPTRLLWISDIHFRETYQENTSLTAILKPFLNAFLQKVEELHKVQPINYILLTGDLAFAGTKDDYDSLFDLVIKPLYDRLGKENTPKTITIPGNHDVFRSTIPSSYYTLAPDQFKERWKVHEDKTKLLKNDTNGHNDIFREYSQAFSNKHIIDRYSRQPPFKLINDDDIIYSEDYANKHRLWGYVIDKKRELVFILLNSAWFSFGASKIDDIVKAKWQNKTVDDVILKELLSLKEILAEEGGQIIGENLIKDLLKDDILNKIEYKKFTFITCMHHPLHWMHWYEQFNYDSNNQPLLAKLVERSDLLLTGHEHVPNYIRPEKIYDDTWYFRAGVFLKDNIKEDDPNPFAEHNRFAILDIKPVANDVTYNEYEYKTTTESWDLVPSKKSSQYPLTRLKDFIFKEPEFENLRQKAGDFNLAGFLAKYASQFGLSAFDTAKLSPLPDLENANVWIYESADKEYRLFVLLTKHKAYEVLNLVCDKLKETIQFKKPLYISFLCLDLFVLPEGSNPYIKVSDSGTKMAVNRSEEFGKIYAVADVMFNVFRHKLFVRYEPTAEDKLKREPNSLFNELKDMKFTHRVIPFLVYWKFVKKSS